MTRSLAGASLDEINSIIVECALCPRLVAWREEAALPPVSPHRRPY